MAKRWGLTAWPAALLVPMAVLGGTAASAATCTEQLQEFARDHDLMLSTPMPSQPPTGETGLPGGTPETSSPGSADLGSRLAESGGVIAPPPVRDPSVLEPPPVASRMPTAPAIKPETPVPPQAQPGGPTAAGNPPLEPSTRAQAQALMDAALAAAEQGDEPRCLDGLAKTQALVKQSRRDRPG